MSLDQIRHAQQILNQRLLPGRDQEQIYESISSLEHIISNIKETNTRQANRLLTQTQDLYQIAELQRLNPNTPIQVREGLDDMTKYLSDMLTRMHRTPVNPKHLLISTQALKQQNILSTLNLSAKEYKHIPYLKAEINPQTQQAIQKTGLQAHIEHLYSIRPQPSISHELWNLETIGLPQGWKHNAGDNTKIGVIDTGCKITHAEIHHSFTDKLGYNFIDDNQHIDDDNGHGTHVAGIISGIDTGVAPNAQLYALKILDHNGIGVESGFLQAAEWAIDNQLDVLNASFGSQHASNAEKLMVQALNKHNITLVAAAGNNGDNSYSYPASYQGVISVAATNKKNVRAPFSQQNDQLTISAPGVGIHSCVPGGYDQLSGTSMAAPHVTGAVAMLYTNGDKKEIIPKLTSSAQELGPSNEYGAGLLRVDKMIT